MWVRMEDTDLISDDWALKALTVDIAFIERSMSVAAMEV